MARIVILGAGFGGLTAATELRRRLPREHAITLVDDRGRFVMGLSHLWALDGRRPIAAGRRDWGSLRAPDVARVQARVERIDTARRTVTAGGRELPYDALVVALGAELAPDAVPGFDAARNLYDPAGVERLAAELARFEGGRILFAIAGTPFKCPPAPYEAAMLTAALLERRGLRRRTEIELTTPEPRPLPVAPPSCGADVITHLKGRGIAYSPDHKPKAVHAADRTVEYENGARKPYDLLVGVPVHRAPAVVREAGLTDASGWVPVDPFTLATTTPGVWAVGDVTLLKTPSGKPLPKAGLFAESEARVVASNLAATLLGGAASARFDGVGQCFLELGDGVATAVDGRFFATPEPEVTLRMPTAETLKEKERFETERLRAWFGG